jgi:2-iminobutanoate/2-iminopropanoate deaminase
MTIHEIHSDELSAPAGMFSHAMLVSNAHTLLFLSGLTARDINGDVIGVGDVKFQTETILDNMGKVLAAAGATYDDVLRVTVYITDMSLFDQIHEVRGRYFAPPYPASTMVEVSALARPGMLIEIEAIAAPGQERRGA